MLGQIAMAEGEPVEAEADCIGRKVSEPERVRVGQIASPDADIPF